MSTRQQWNGMRYDGGAAGHYESWFQRANDPTRPRAFWIRYTVFSPRGRPEDAVGELWAIAFDQEAERVTAVKRVVPWSQCSASSTGLDVHIADAGLDASTLRGQATTDDRTLRWDLRYEGDAPPLPLLPTRLYRAPLPRAKAVVGLPFARYFGTLEVEGTPWSIDGWVGSQNHNWGRKHTDHYAWGQVAGFDDAQDAFLECISASLRIGPLSTPLMTLAVLRLGDEEIRFDGIREALGAQASLSYFDWSARCRRRDAELQLHISAPRSTFVALRYDNPPGGHKTCLNSKLGRCEVTLRKRGHAAVHLSTQHRAAFEIVTDDDSHGLTTSV